MEILQIDDGKKGQFYYEVNGAKLGLMTYSRAGADKIIIDLTEVDESLKGQGVGYKLVEAAIEYAREQQIKILPLCLFAAAVFKKRSEYSDVKF